MPSPANNNTEQDEPLFKRPTGILLDEKQWLYLKERYHMTTRELQVAILVCRGFNNNEIAKALKIRHGTVKTHLRNLYRKARVKTKILLLLKLIEDVSKFYVPPKPASPSIPITEIPSKSEDIAKTSRKK